MKQEPSKEGIVHVVDDDEAMRSLVIRTLATVGLPCVGWSSPVTLLENLAAQQIDTLIVDIRLSGMSGLELVRKLRELGIAAPCIFISGVDEVPVAVEAMKLGALDFLQKPFATQTLIDTTQNALRSHREGTQSRLRVREVLALVEKLSPRERQVFLAVVDGKANKVVAADLGLSEKTVEEHRARAMSKLGAASLADLVKIAVVAGLCEPARARSSVR
jgi:two-component system response regulator FixJ